MAKEPSILERIHELNEEVEALRQQRKGELMTYLTASLQELDSLGFKYQLVEVEEGARPSTGKKKVMSAEARAKIADAQKARWEEKKALTAKTS